MPAIITHDTFGHEVYGKLYQLIGGSRDEAHAFLLGNQGPDPLFYAVANPRIAPAHRLGSIMHDKHPDELLEELRRAVTLAPAEDRSIARAYALGFICHYLLDSTAHPFVFAQQYALCDAGVPGLTRADGGDVHALIESELDELVLTTRRGETIATFNPSKAALRATDHVLDVVTALYDHVAQRVYDTHLPHGAYKASTKAFRLVQALFYSPSGFKHNAIGRIELLARRHSFFRAMSHRNLERTSSAFANQERETWTNPFTKEPSCASFVDLFERAQEKAANAFALFDAPSFGKSSAEEITCGLNFSGEAAYPHIVSVSNVEDSR